jgi:hypothetical protein
MRKYNKLILVGGAIAALAAPSAAMASPATNPSQKDAVGYSVSVGNAQIAAGDVFAPDGSVVQNRGEWNKILRTTDIADTWRYGDLDFANTGDSVQWTRDVYIPAVGQNPANDTPPGQAK